MSTIINLTQHAPSKGQRVFEPADKAEVQRLLTFEEVPSLNEMIRRAARLAEIAKSQNAKKAMIGGAPFFMAPLEAALVRAGIQPVYAFSRREIVEAKQPDGSVRKTAVFRHLGYVPAATRWWNEFGFTQEGGVGYYDNFTVGVPDTRYGTPAEKVKWPPFG